MFCVSATCSSHKVNCICITVHGCSLFFHTGLAIGGGIDTTRSEITIMEVKEGGAAHNNGFLKVS